MNWIKLTPESVLPEKQEVFVRIFDGLFIYHKTGFSTGNIIALDNEEMEPYITHYCLIEEPADVPKPEPAKPLTEKDKANLPFS